MQPREVFPEGLPPSYVFVATVRIKASSRKLSFDLWRVLSKDKKIQAAVTLNGKDKSVTFVTTRASDEQQSVVFQGGFQVCMNKVYFFKKTNRRTSKTSSRQPCL